MGQQRILFITVSVIFIGVAIAVALFHFSSAARSLNKDGLIHGINTLASFASEYRLRPPNLGGGGGSFVGFDIPEKLATTDVGMYTATVSRNSILFMGTSSLGYGTVQAMLDSAGQLKNFMFTGEFE